jgi:hypothetical protein
VERDAFEAAPLDVCVVVGAGRVWTDACEVGCDAASQSRDPVAGDSRRVGARHRGVGSRWWGGVHPIMGSDRACHLECPATRRALRWSPKSEVCRSGYAAIIGGV